MNISTQDVAEAVLVNFRRLSPTDRRQILQQLMSDLDAPQQTDEAPEGANGRELGASIPSSGLLGWWEENMVLLQRMGEDEKSPISTSR